MWPILLAAIAAAIVAAGAVLMMAGGHGWIAAAFSLTALVTAPAGAVSWVSHRRGLARAVMIVNAVVDLLFAAAAAKEGLGYAANTFSHLAPVVVIWAVLWAGCQTIPVATLLRRDG